MRDDYSDIYNVSFKFTAYRRKLYHTIATADDAETDIPQEYKNNGGLYVWCHPCMAYMIFHKDEGLLNGYWQCPRCGRKVHEETPYRHFSREDEETERQERLAEIEREAEDDNDWD
jgi:hypothetical protein